ATEAQSTTPYEPVPAEERMAWKTFFRDRLQESTTWYRYWLVWNGIRGLADAGALAIAGAKLHSLPQDSVFQRRLVRNASRVAAPTGLSTWPDFQNAAQPWATLTPEAQQVLAAPSGCP